MSKKNASFYYLLCIAQLNATTDGKNEVLVRFYFQLNR